MDWTFEAFDGENWRQLCNFARPMPASGPSGWHGRRGFWRLNTKQVASNRFRIRLLECDIPRCMHVRGLEIYGTIMPPWRID